MKIWELARDKELIRVRREYEITVEKVNKKWLDFQRTGVCEGISCYDCPMLNNGCSATCQEVAKKILNEDEDEEAEE